MAVASCPFCSQLQVAGDGLVEVVGYLARKPTIEEVSVLGGAVGRFARPPEGTICATGDAVSAWAVSKVTEH